ncbi:MAG: bacteriorhodopsin [Synechococcales bacterium]|nr:bacteriorhodopsin [Synechococcales bacterium]
MENFLTYTPVQWTIVINVLTLGYAAMAAGLVYFWLTREQAAPRYRLSSALSAVVMASAVLELFRLAQNWANSFQLTAGVVEAGDAVFANGFRYMNWSIDVPVLLTQILVVLGFQGKRFKGPWVKFTVAGLLMIWTGYIGQFYESAGAAYENVSLAPYWIWGAISTVFFIYIIYLVWKEISRGLQVLPDNGARGMMKAVRWLLIISWCGYVVAYLMPVISFTAWGVVARQVIYTAADIVSKVIYGVMLGRVATLRSQAEGYTFDVVEEASLGRVVPGRR